MKITLIYANEDGTELAGTEETIDFIPTIGAIIENDSLKYSEDEKVEEIKFIVKEIKYKKINGIFVCEVEARAI